MHDDIVLVEVDGPVATVTLNRPDARNALNRALRKALPATLRELDERDDIAAIEKSRQAVVARGRTQL